MGDGGVDGVGSGEKVNHAHSLFDRFVQASTCKGTLKAFQELCDFLELRPSDCRIFYHKLKSRLNYWKAKALWAKLDKRACHKEYKKGRACANSKCLIIGAGPCGLRTAIELAFLGAKVVLLEKRDAFSRNNVLHLWPFTIQDLRGLGAKKFYGKFCAGAIDHISIRQLQLVLLKVALLLGIEIHVNVEFKGLIEPPEEQENNRFRRKEFRGKLAIAITANFINRHTSAEAKVEEISGVAFIFNQKFFQDLREATGIDLENIVYYKDDTHYFVMTAKKQSLLEKGVILQDYVDTELLLSRGNVDQAALLSYAREAADFSTNHQLPTLDFAINHYGQPDVAMFDFTCMYASENAALVRQRNGHKLLVTLVGDSLLEPFWPMGTGIARGFLAAMDSAWMVRSWAQGSSPLETTPENVSKNFSQYSLDPTTRYPNISLNFLRPAQVQHLLDTGECKDSRVHFENMINASTPKLKRNESIARSSKLLSWCQRQTEGYQHVCVTNLTTSWKSGLALCAIIHHYRPDLIEFDSLEEQDIEGNNQLAFDVAEREFGISPIMTGEEMSSVMEPDQLSMVMYLSQFYEMFKDMVPPGEKQSLSPEQKAALIASNKSPISFLSMLGQTVSRKRVPKARLCTPRADPHCITPAGSGEDPQSHHDNRPPLGLVLMEPKVGGKDKVKSMANQLLAKFEENAPTPLTGLKRQGDSMSSLEFLMLPSPPPAPTKEPASHGPAPTWRQVNSDPSTAGEVLSCPHSALPYSVMVGLHQCSTSTLLRPKMLISVERGRRAAMLSFPQAAEPNLSRGCSVSLRADKQLLCLKLSCSLSLCLSLSCFYNPVCPLHSGFHRYVKRYTGGVSSLAEQIANQLQTQEEPKPLLDKREVNLGGSDVCFFCQKRVYVMERLSAEGKFFHRSCFKCDYCGTTLRLSSYAFDVFDGKFYCKPHYCYRLSGQAQRKRPAPTVAPPTAQEAQAPPPVPVALDMSGQANLASLTERRPSVEVIGLQEPSLAKRLRSTPERIELENYRSSISLQRPEDLEEEPEEVPEETLAEHNLSSLPHKSASAEPGSSSSESEEEEEDEEEERAPSDLGGVAWKDAVEMHAKLRRGADCPGKEEEVEEESEEDSEEDEEEEESSDGRTHAERQEAVRAWVESLSGEAELKPSAASERQTQRPVKSSVSPQQSLGEDVLSPAKDVHQASVASPPPYLLRSGLRFFPEPCPPDEAKTQQTPESPDAKSPRTPKPSGSPQHSPHTPTHLQPSHLLDSVRLDTPTSISICLPLPSAEPALPLPPATPSRAPPAPPSTPLLPPATPADSIKEFRLKSTETHQSLGHTPVGHTPMGHTPVGHTPMGHTPMGHTPVGHTPVGHSAAPPSSASPRQGCSSSSGPGLKSDGYTPDSTLLTPPSSPPPPPPPNEEPASLCCKKHSISQEAVPAATPTPVLEPKVAPRPAGGLCRRDAVRVRHQDKRPSFMDSVDDIPYADDEEDNWEECTPELLPRTSQLEPTALPRTSQLEPTALPRTSQPEPTALPRTSQPEPTTLPRTSQPEPTALPRTSHPKPTALPRISRSELSPLPRTSQTELSPLPRASQPELSALPRTSQPELSALPRTSQPELSPLPRTSQTELSPLPRTSHTTWDTPPCLPLNGLPSVLAVGGRKGVTEVTAQARLVAEERLRAREKSIKSQALKDAMARQLSRMKEADTSSMPGAAATAMDSGKANALLVPGSDPETHKQGELQLPDEVFTTQGDGRSVEGSGGRSVEGSGGRSAEGSGGRSAEGSGTSSGSSAGHRNKKSSSLFTPRKSKKEKKAENELSDDPPKHKSLWKTVFSGHRKDKKKEESQSSSLTGSGAVDSVERRTSPRSRSSDLLLQRRPSLSVIKCYKAPLYEIQFHACRTPTLREGQHRISVYVPHALAFKRAYAVKKKAVRKKKRGSSLVNSRESSCPTEVIGVLVAVKEASSLSVSETLFQKAYTEEELNAKLTRRVQKAARRQAKQEELKRLHRAQ
ncbi:hypothetical protein JZ751_027343, partial [Albula glossodonta]